MNSTQICSLRLLIVARAQDTGTGLQASPVHKIKKHSLKSKLSANAFLSCFSPVSFFKCLCVDLSFAQKEKP